MKGFFMKKLIAFLLSFFILFSLSACGNKETASSSITYHYKDQTVQLKDHPKRVVTLTTPLLNMVYAVNGTSLARPTTSNPIPKEAKSLPELGHVQNINIEKLVQMQPDFVIGEKKQNEKLTAMLDSSKIPYLLINYDGINDNIPLIQFLGDLYNQKDTANELIKSYQKRVTEIEEKAAKEPKVTVAVLRATGKAVTAETPLSIGASMAELLHLDNVVVKNMKNYDTKTVPYSLEQLSYNNPDVIFIVTMGKMDEINKKLDEEMSSNPSWSQLKAVKNHRVYFLPPDLFLLNPGLRTPDALEQMYELAYHP